MDSGTEIARLRDDVKDLNITINRLKRAARLADVVTLFFDRGLDEIADEIADEWGDAEWDVAAAAANVNSPVGKETRQMTLDRLHERSDTAKRLAQIKQRRPLVTT